MSREQWLEARELFEEIHGREPSDQEMQEAYIDYVSSIMDAGKELRKYGE